MLDDFAPLFDELGVLAVCGAQSAMVLFDTPDTVGDYAISVVGLSGHRITRVRARRLEPKADN